jgi:protein O-mannosyl-transferase
VTEQSPRSRLTSRSRRWWAACALCVITLLVYANSFKSGFVLDNHFFVLEDSRIRQPTLANLALILHHTYWWPLSESGLYRPVTTLSILFNYAILGNADFPAGYHWVNLILHAGNVLLVFALARRLVRDLRPSFLIAALWAVHPVLTESVTNIVGRADLLAGMTSLGGLLIYLRSMETSGWRRWAWLAGLAAVTALGVFSKENAVVVAGIVALHEFTWWNPARLRGFLLGCIAMSPAFLAMWWVRSSVFAGLPPTVFPFVDNPIAAVDFVTGRLTALKVMAKSAALLVWPAHLSIDYSYAQIPLADGRPTDWIAWTVVVAMALAMAFFFRRNKTAFFAAGFAFVTFLPTSNLLVPVGAIMAERFLYLPAIGFSICLTLALCSIGRRMRLGATAPFVIGVLIVVAFGVRTRVRNADWRDDITLWSAAARTSPLSFKTHMGLANALLAWNRDLEIDRALEEDERALAVLDSLPPRFAGSAYYIKTGLLYMEKGNTLERRDPGRISDYTRAKSLLLRGSSIMRIEEHKTDPAFRTDADIFVDRMILESDRRSKVTEP